MNIIENLVCKKCGDIILNNTGIEFNCQVVHKRCLRCFTCHRMLKMDNIVETEGQFYCADCARSLNLGLDCKFCKGLCWEENHNYKLDDEIKDRATLIKPLRKRNLVPVKAKEKNRLSMEKADNGVGALYIVMDTLRRRRAEQKEEEKKQKLEENFHNGINKGREILKPL
eukprot:TRINITY_DN25624_c0_g1_i3.p1 TRINITY_DN25624_c0_g1~~TRINITY_DN25624_c0_g1_i3.p1  ORF type:complete len:170 (+),score=48.10 TRINITY_DN25624_c0_g1_i3:35-544(+)